MPQANWIRNDVSEVMHANTPVKWQGLLLGGGGDR